MTLKELDNHIKVTPAVIVGTTNRDLVLADNAGIIETNETTVNTITIQPDSDLDLPIGFYTNIVQFGTGGTSLVAGDGVTIYAPGDSLSLRGRYSACFLYKRAADEWVLLGTGTPAPSDVTAPSLQTAVVTNSVRNKIVLTYNEDIDTGAGLAYTDFTVSSGKTPTAILISGSTITITVDTSFTSSDTITISGGASKIKDAAGNISTNLSSQAVDNQINPSVAMTQTGLDSSGDPWLAASTTGWQTGDVDGVANSADSVLMYARRTNSDGIYFMLGLDASSVAGAYTGWDAGFLVDAGGAVSKITAGSFGSLSYNLPVGDYIGLLFVDSTTMKVVSSTDTITWTDRGTITGSFPDPMYPFAAIYSDGGTVGKLYSPMQSGFS